MTDFYNTRQFDPNHKYHYWRAPSTQNPGGYTYNDYVLAKETTNFFKIQNAGVNPTQTIEAMQWIYDPYNAIMPLDEWTKLNQEIKDTGSSKFSDLTWVAIDEAHQERYRDGIIRYSGLNWDYNLKNGHQSSEETAADLKAITDIDHFGDYYLKLAYDTRGSPWGIALDKAVADAYTATYKPDHRSGWAKFVEKFAPIFVPGASGGGIAAATHLEQAAEGNEETETAVIAAFDSAGTNVGMEGGGTKGHQRLREEWLLWR
jgi:hypothetical protein